MTELRPYLGTAPLDPQNNASFNFQYTYYVTNYIFNSSTGCRSGDYLSTGLWQLSVRFESASFNPFDAGSGAAPTVTTRCGSALAAGSTDVFGRYFSPVLKRVNP